MPASSGPLKKNGPEPGSRILAPAGFEECLGEVYSALSQVGGMPFQPPTPRGRLGAALVFLVRRLLFWFIPQLDRFHAAIVRTLEAQAEAIEQLAAANRQLDQAIGRALEEFATRQEALHSQPPPAFADYLPAVRAAGAATPAAPLLDLFSGRGEWLEVLRAGGLTGSGVEPDHELAAACHARNLDVLPSEPVPHLCGLPESSLGAVTAFRSVHELPMEQISVLFDGAVRALRPGGVLLIGNSRNGMEDKSSPPVPQRVLAFLMELRGLCRVETLPSGAVAGRKPA